MSISQEISLRQPADTNDMFVYEVGVKVARETSQSPQKLLKLFEVTGHL